MEFKKHLVRLARWRLVADNKEVERCASLSEGLSQLEALKGQSHARAKLRNPFTKVEYHLQEHEVKKKVNEDGFASFFQGLLLLIGIMATYLLLFWTAWALNLETVLKVLSYIGTIIGCFGVLYFLLCLGSLTDRISLLGATPFLIPGVLSVIFIVQPSIFAKSNITTTTTIEEVLPLTSHNMFAVITNAGSFVVSKGMLGAGKEVIINRWYLDASKKDLLGITICTASNKDCVPAETYE